MFMLAVVAMDTSYIKGVTILQAGRHPADPISNCNTQKRIRGSQTQTNEIK